MIDAALAEGIYARALEIADEETGPEQKIPAFRGLLEELFRALSAESGELLSSLFARIAWVLERNPAPPEVERGVHGLRRLADDVLHGNLQAGEDLLRGGLRGLCLAVAHFSGRAVTPELETRWEGKPAPFHSRRPDPDPPEIVSFVRALVLKPGPQRRHRRPDGEEVAVSDLFCDLGPHGTASVALWDRFAPLAGLARKHSTVHFFGLRRTRGRDRVFFSTLADRTLAVLEPDFLVEAGELARFSPRGVFQPALWLTARCLREERSLAVLRGNLVNGMLDRLLAAGGARGRFEEHYPELCREHALALSLLTAEERTGLEASVKEQFAVLQKLLPELELDRAAVEPSFFSDRYGLQGRLDVMAVGGEEWRRDLYELKSGQPPASGAWPGDHSQTAAYDLLLDSVSGERRRGRTAVIYSRDPLHPLRPCESTLAERQRLLMNRNRLVARERDLAGSEFDPPACLAPVEGPPLAEFQQRRVDRFQETWDRADPLARSYFLAFLRFVAREKRQAWVGGEVEARPGFSALWQRSLEEKLRAFALLPWLEPRPGPEGDPRRLELARSARTPAVSGFRNGDAALLYAMEGERCDPARRQVTKCTVTALTPETVTVRLRNPQLGAAHFRAHRFWALEPDLLDQGFTAMSRSLFELLAASPERRESLLGLRRPRFASRPASPVAPGLDARQAEIVERALAARDWFLVQGPPGTGKTRLVLYELARRLFHESSETVLLAAFTNQAADEICAALERVTADFIRLGRAEAVSPRFHPRLLASLPTSDPEVLRARLETARLWVSTVASLAAHEEIFELKRFDTLVVDEASQLLEPQLVGLLCRARRFILIGDEKQLPAVVRQPGTAARTDAPELRSIGLHDLRLSLFERLLGRARGLGWDDAHAMLTRQGRMHRDLAALPSRLFYGNRLELLDAERQAAPIAGYDSAAADPLERALAASRLLYLPSRPDPLNQQNRDEAQRVVRVLEAARRAGGASFDEAGAGVITPFRRQIAAILTRLPRELARLVTVDTVERFQGSERDLIVLSLALRHPAQLNLIRSLSPDRTVDRKLNVALTRARSHLVVTGLEEVLGSDPFYGELIRACLRVEL